MTYMPPASPVNLDASITSLSAGSLTTVARADHVHTVSKVPVLLARTTLSSALNTVILSSINQSFTALQIIANARNSWTGGYTADAHLRVNGSTSSIYYDGYNGGALLTKLVNPLPATGNFFSSMNGMFYWIIHQYATTMYKNVHSGYMFNNSASGFAAAPQNQKIDVIATTSPITSVSVEVNNLADAFVAGSTFALYGIP